MFNNFIVTKCVNIWECCCRCAIHVSLCEVEKTYLKPGEMVIGTADSSDESESLELILNFDVLTLPNVLVG